MSAGYKPILWNPFKQRYDLVLWVGIILYLVCFVGYTVITYPTQNLNTTLIRAFGTLALLLLHVILIVGPVCRLNKAFLPILYNRRHLGVSLFLIAVTHGILSVLWFHGSGNEHPLISLFTANLHYNSFQYFPFQPLGFVALVILAIMAFTSHDFWLSYLHPKFWKAMHMLVYVAYALVIMHVALGIIQYEKSPVLVVLLFTGLLVVSVLHLLAALKENRIDDQQIPPAENDWQFVCNVNDIEEDRAKIAVIDKERIAVFKYNGKLSAVHNVCKHQLGPLGEGKVIDGCVTCPWHGYQYRPEDGCAPPHFTEKLATYALELRDNDVYINVTANPEGTFVEPLIIADAQATKPKKVPFFIGWSGQNASKLLRPAGIAALLLLVLLIGTAFVLASRQQRISTYQINYDQVKEIEGWLTIQPVPMLTVIDGKDGDGNPMYTSILLIDALKFGANKTVDKVLAGTNTRYVKIKGYASHDYIGCGGIEDSAKNCEPKCVQCLTGTTQFPLFEIENGTYSFTASIPPVSNPELQLSAGFETALKGQIIDPKCYFGAMNPGEGAPHQSCAVRCISGGIMPVLKFTNNTRPGFAVLVDKNGKPINNQVLQYVSMSVEITGQLATFNNWKVLFVDDGGIHQQ